jgi:hypothetical protein
MRPLARVLWALAAGCLAALAAAEAASASPPVLAQGQLHDAAGQPSAGEVRLYAWPHHKRAMTSPLIGTATADASGTYVALVRDPDRLARLARQRDGWLDVKAVGEAGAYEGEWTFTVFVAGNGSDLRVVPPAGVTARAGIASVLGASQAPTVPITAARPLPRAVRAAQVVGGEPVGDCRPEHQTQPVRKTSAWAIVGELNNAYNDGTGADFTYARQQTADTSFGIGMSNDSGDNWFIGGESYIGDRGELSFPFVQRRYSRKMRSKFEFTREAARNHTCAKWDIYIRATQWLLGTDMSRRQKRALDRCDPRYIGGNLSGSRFRRDSESAVRYNRGVQAFGVYLTTRSGFSTQVTLEYAFRGPRGKRHYICGGESGRQSAATAGRVWSGARG